MIAQLPSLVPYSPTYIAKVQNLEQIIKTNPAYLVAAEQQIKKLRSN